MSVITRFAPSPTGSLHIGGARTALFNMLFARHFNGKFLLRIEDTDKKRSTDKAIEIILNDLNWLGLHWDDKPIYQSDNFARHIEIVNLLLSKGNAYKCYSTPKDLELLRENQIKEGKPYRYDGKWRNKSSSEAPDNIKPVVRLKAPLDGETIINDLVQGTVKTLNKELDDMVLLRSDGTPTFMLAVVVDDYDMGITHVIRGDDHLTNAFRQRLIYDSLGWVPPKYFHIPLIHGSDGKKLSKRNEAIGANSYRKTGYLPEALRNYLLKLGWGHGDDEIISDTQAIEWFDGSGIGKSSAKFDRIKLTSINANYLKLKNNTELLILITPLIEEKLGYKLDNVSKDRVIKGMNGIKERSKTLLDLMEQSLVYIKKTPILYEEKAKKILDNDTQLQLNIIIDSLGHITEWDATNLEVWARSFSEENNIKLGKIAQPIRAAITGSTQSPPIFEVMAIFGKEEVIYRLKQAIKMV